MEPGIQRHPIAAQPQAHNQQHYTQQQEQNQRAQYDPIYRMLFFFHSGEAPFSNGKNVFISLPGKKRRR